MARHAINNDEPCQLNHPTMNSPNPNRAMGVREPAQSEIPLPGPLLYPLPTVVHTKAPSFTIRSFRNLNLCKDMSRLSREAVPRCDLLTLYRQPHDYKYFYY